MLSAAAAAWHAYDGKPNHSVLTPGAEAQRSLHPPNQSVVRSTTHVERGQRRARDGSLRKPKTGRVVAALPVVIDERVGAAAARGLVRGIQGGIDPKDLSAFVNGLMQDANATNFQLGWLAGMGSGAVEDVWDNLKGLYDLIASALKLNPFDAVRVGLHLYDSRDALAKALYELLTYINGHPDELEQLAEALGREGGEQLTKAISDAMLRDPDWYNRGHALGRTMAITIVEAVLLLVGPEEVATKLRLSGRVSEIAARIAAKAGRTTLGRRRIPKLRELLRAAGLGARAAAKDARFAIPANLLAEHGRVKSDVARAVREVGAGLKPGVRVKNDYPELMEKLAGWPDAGTNALILKNAPTVWKALHDPELIAEVAADVWADSKALAPKGTLDPMSRAIVRRWAAENGSRVRRIPPGGGGGDEPFFRDWGGTSRGFVDRGIDTSRHGQMTHLLQDLIVDRALARAGSPLTSREFRQALQGILPAGGGSTPVGKDLFIRLYDNVDDFLNAPENLTASLRKVAGFENYR